MTSHQLFVMLAISAGLILVLNALSSWIRSRWITDPLVALLIGVVVGRHGFGWFHLEDLGEPMMVLEEAARLTLAVGLMGIALRLPNYLLGPGNELVWPLTSLIITLSVVLHGLTATPFSRWLGSHEDRSQLDLNHRLQP